MAQSQGNAQALANELEIIEFYIDEKLPDGTTYRGFYGMNVVKVLGIIRLPDFIDIPSKHHEAVLGTFNLRGRILPLVSLSLCLEKESESSKADKVIVSEFFGVTTAFLVSGVTRIHRLSWTQIEAPDGYVQQYSDHSVTGVVRIEDRLLFILDMENILTMLNPKLAMSSMVDDADKHEGEVEDAENFHILIAEDSRSIRAAVTDSLEKFGYKTTSVQSGQEAWDLLNTWKSEAGNNKEAFFDKVQLVISDIEMPNMDGHTLTQHIRDDMIMHNMPVVLFSSLQSEASRAKGELVGADAQISKPDLPVLTNIVRGIIRKKLGK